MPFSLRTTELTGDPIKAFIIYADENFSPDQQKKMYQVSGRTREDWGTLSKVSHGDYIALRDGVYAVLGNSDPEQMHDIGALLARTPTSVPALIARGLGSPDPVMRTLARFTPSFTLDSRLSVPQSTKDSSIVQQTTLGATALMYPEQDTHGVGYFKSLEEIQGLASFSYESLMVQFQLPFLLANAYSFLDLDFAIDKNGNLIGRESKVLARPVRFVDTEFGEIGLYDYPQLISQLTQDIEIDGSKLPEGSFVFGSPSDFSRKNLPKEFFAAIEGKTKELALEELILFEALEDLTIDGVRVIREGVIYGGKHPAPASIHKFSWEEQTGLRHKIWRIYMNFRLSLGSREAIVETRKLADAEADRRGRAEEGLNLAQDSLRSLTAQRFKELKETEKARNLLSGTAHDFKGYFRSAARRSVESLVSIIGLADLQLTDEEREIVYDDFESFDVLKEEFEDNNIDHWDIEDVFERLTEVTEKGRPKIHAHLVNHTSWLGRYKDWLLSRAEAAAAANTLGKKLETLPFRPFFEDAFKNNLGLAQGVKIELDIPEDLKVNCYKVDLQLVTGNLMVNAIEAAKTSLLGQCVPFIIIFSSLLPSVFTETFTNGF